MTVSKALEDLKSEIEDRICAITPNLKVKQRATFTPHKSESKEITEVTGSSRLFSVGVPILSDSAYQVGWDSHHVSYVVPVTIAYRRSFEWAAAAADDIIEIMDNFGRNPLVSTNSDIAHFSVFEDDRRGASSVTNHPNEPWDYHTILVRVYISITT